jgi:hypothetical protein
MRRGRDKDDAKARHQAQILRDFQEAARTVEAARTLLAEAHDVTARAEAKYEAAKRAMRRVAEGSI